MKHLKTILQSKLFYIILVLLTCLYVFLNVSIIKRTSIYNEDDNKFIGRVVKIKQTDYGYSLTLKSQEDLIIYTEEFNYNLGDIILVTGNLKLPKNNTVINNFNYKEYLYQNKIFYTVDATTIKLLQENNNLIYKIKMSLLNHFDTFKSKDYLKSFVLGDTSYLLNDLYQSYQINGVCHLLSIGSTHITLLTILILFILKKLKVNEIISHIILFTIIMFFIVLTDYPISIIRVFIYLILSFLNNKLNLKIKSINLFILTLVITLIINPFYIYHKGFLYSYTISFILILNQDKLTGNYLTKLLKISFISFLSSIPYNIYFNYSINLLSIFYNLLYVPVFNIIVFPLSLLTLIFNFLDNSFFKLMELLNLISYNLNNYTWGIYILKKLSFLFLVIYMLIVAYVIKDVLNKKKKGIIILIIVLVIHFNINDIIKKDFYMVIDVKQGDSSLLYSNNKSILIDTGGLYNQEVSEKTITMLKSLGIRKINYLFLTHGDYDHMGDSIYFINNFEVENVIFNHDSFNDLEQKLIKELQEKNIKYYENLKELNIENSKLYFLNNKLYDNENDNSNVIYTEINGIKLLLMGDASKEVEEDIIEKYDIKDIDILKVGHHGSKTSSSKEFIDRINPKYSVISVGENNRYNHPNKEVLDNLDKSTIYRTDQDGSIMFKINNKLEIETCPP